MVEEKDNPNQSRGTQLQWHGEHSWKSPRTHRQGDLSKQTRESTDLMACKHHQAECSKENYQVGKVYKLTS